MIDLQSAGRLLDFSGRIADDIAEGQLEGAVALHNILERHGVAYLADEVGMGKTLVALGVLALYRHWNPDFRAMIIAPRENIQKKWVKEFRQFARNNVRFRDLRVRALHDAPARTLVHCHDLLHLVRETTLDPDRDFVARMTSFSLAFGSPDRRQNKRNQLLEHVPWLDSSLLDLRNKDAFTQNFARTVCCVLPVFDLLIVDEAHNLKHGYRSTAIRNRVMAAAFGRDDDVPARFFPEYGVRARRVLLLSATPVETDYRQLWNQLDVVGKANAFDVLKSDDSTPEEKRDCGRRILVRRITSLSATGTRLTKNLYRREWREGGVGFHDVALDVPDHKRRLIVALVQKKVSETLQSPRFNNSFQIGMLASFESFLETAKLRKTDETDPASNFDQSDQTTDELEREGVDVAAINRLARDYRRRFGAELPHPKMDAVVEGLAESFETGEKALVFVRRVASVRELKRKLDQRYDEQLLSRLRKNLEPGIAAELDRLHQRYRDERRLEIEREERRSAPGDTGPTEAPRPDPGGKDTFFAWFFRGEGPEGAFSGATLQRRFGQASAALSTFFEDNWVAWLLGVAPDEVPAALTRHLGKPWDELDTRMRESVRRWLGPGRPAERRNYFLAFQRAALELLEEGDDDVAQRAKVILGLRYHESAPRARWTGEPPPAEDWLTMPTLFTAIRAHVELAELLSIDSPEVDVPPTEFAVRFRERETRRELFSAICRLGNASIDLFVLVANRLGSLRHGARTTGDDDISIIDALVDLLSAQSRSPSDFRAYHEIREALTHFDLLLDLNAPDARTTQLSGLTELFGKLLREQQPVGGTSGRVNETLVRQFRMPGYPFILVTTDLLREGEDLHTFCSAVYHYGISWMPSSMEQRIGRIDRVNSATQRRLGRLDRLPVGDELLQVYYPHLKETVEVLQVDRVLQRMGEFVRLMHEDLIMEGREEKRIDLANEILRDRRNYVPSNVPLETAFAVTPEMLKGKHRPLAVSPTLAEELTARFRRMPDLLSSESIDWHATRDHGSLIGILRIGARMQPFTLFLRSAGARQLVRCVSPVGRIAAADQQALARWETRSPIARIASVIDAHAESYNLTIEGDIALGPAETDSERVAYLIRSVATEADEIEAELTSADADPTADLSTLRQEIVRER
jgi:hypothetical protein